MFHTLMFVTFAVAVASCFIVVMLFRTSIPAILAASSRRRG